MKNKLIALFLFFSQVVLCQNSTTKRDSIITELKKTAAHGMQVLEKYYPEGALIVKASQTSKDTFLIGGYDYIVEVEDVFYAQFQESGTYGFLDGISTGVHEECHGLDVLKAYALLEQKTDIKPKDVDYYQGIYISEDEFVLIKMDRVIPCSLMVNSIPEQLRNTRRFAEYIYPSRDNNGPQVIGVYALLDEWNAYYHGLRTALELKDYVKNELEQTDLNWAIYFTNIYDDFNASVEFKLWILEYLNFTRKNYKKEYKSIIQDQEFKKAFWLIQKNYDSFERDFAKYKEEIIKYLATLDIEVKEEEEGIKVGNKKMKMKALPMYKIYNEFLKNPNYHYIQTLEELKK